MAQLDKSLIRAVESGESPGILQLLRQDPELKTAVDSRGRTLLHLAVHHNQSVLIRRLLALGLDPNTVDRDGKTPLHTACLARSEDSIWLLWRVSSLVAQDSSGKTPLHYAAEQGLTRVLQEAFSALSFDEREHYLSIRDEGGNTLLHSASGQADPEVCRILLIPKQAVNAQNHLGQTALHRACIYGHADVVDTLLRAGADDTMRTTDQYPEPGFTALDLATRFSERHPMLFEALKAYEQKKEAGFHPEGLVLPPRAIKPSLLKDEVVRHLVFEGGGIKGLAYAGAIEVLDDFGGLAAVEDVAGTSAGAITALLLALGYSVPEVSRLLLMDFNQFKDGSWGAARNLARLCQKFGWYKGDAFLEWARDWVSVATGRRHCTFAQLDALCTRQAKQPESVHLRGKYRRLFVVGANLSSGFYEVFSHETTPDMPIADAVRISMSLPGLFKAVQARKIPQANGRWRYQMTKEGALDTQVSDGVVYVDGGILLNYPVGLFDRGGHPSPHTLGFVVDSAQEIALWRGQTLPEERPISDLLGYIKGLLQASLNAQANVFRSDRLNQSRTVYIDTLGVGTTEFELSPERKAALLESGRAATRAFLRARQQPHQRSVIDQVDTLFRRERSTFYGRAVEQYGDEANHTVDLLFSNTDKHFVHKMVSRLFEHPSVLSVLEYQYGTDLLISLQLSEGLYRVWEAKQRKHEWPISPGPFTRHPKVPLPERGTPHLDLFDAAEAGHIEPLQAALRSDPQALRSVNRDGYTLMHAAARMGRTTVMDFLFRQGYAAQFQVRDRQGSLPLHLIAEEGHHLVLAWLSEHHPEQLTPLVLNHPNLYQATPLHRAAAFRQEAVVDWLLAHGVRTDCEDHAGKTPLMIAQQSGVASLIARWNGTTSSSSSSSSSSDYSGYRYTT